jgi:hypothetical protein
MAVGRCLWVWRAAARGEGNPAPAQLVGPLPAAAGAGNWRLFQGRVVSHLYARPAARNAQYLWRIRLRRHLGWRRLHGARRYRRRPGKPHVSARSLARPDVLRCLDRALVRFGEKMEAVVLGRGARADHFRRGAVPRAARNRAARLHTHREQFPSRGDKAVRAQSMRGRMAMLGLYVRQGAPWFADLRAELLSFPAGRHDDQVDALGLSANCSTRSMPDRSQSRRTSYNAMTTARRSRKCGTIVGRRCEAQ